MKMLKILFIGIALLAVSTTVSAQEKSTNTPQQRADAHTERMTKALVLTAEQKAKVAELNLGIAQKNEAIRNDVNMTKEQKQEFIKGNLQGRKDVLKGILTVEQFTKFEANEVKANMKKEAKKEEIKKKKAEQKAIAPPVEIEEL